MIERDYFLYESIHCFQENPMIPLTLQSGQDLLKTAERYQSSVAQHNRRQLMPLNDHGKFFKAALAGVFIIHVYFYK